MTFVAKASSKNGKVGGVAVDDGRDTAIPIWPPSPPETADPFAWWTTAIRSKLRPKGQRTGDLPTQVAIAEELGFDTGAVSNAISRVSPVWRIVKGLSERLKVPLPMILAETKEEAAYLAEQRRLFRLGQADRELAATGEVPHFAAGQPARPSKRPRLRSG